MYQLLSGLYNIHGVGYLHRDLKAANILITSDNVLKITDFGLAKRVTRAARKGGLTPKVCTLWYRAPELLLGSRQYDGKIDLWSAG